MGGRGVCSGREAEGGGEGRGCLSRGSAGLRGVFGMVLAVAFEVLDG